ncbi:MAG: prefoldin domain-containing protein [Candidatus Diapherotrites archaeon]|nr:hypothetical protein [Candidatus Micrarchaeota archaeon]MBU1939876.1 hypothetical protein [Candidatus Micrarchaeota archaeon]
MAREMRISGAQLAQAYEQERTKMEAIINRLNQINNLRMQVMGAVEAVKAVESAEPGTKIKVSLGAGAYIDATIDKNREIDMSLAGNVMKPTAVGKAKAELEKRLAELDTAMAREQKQRETSALNLNQLARAIETIQRDSQARAARQ